MLRRAAGPDGVEDQLLRHVARDHHHVATFEGGPVDRTAPHLDALESGLQAKMAEEIELMQRWPSLALPSGVIHADLFRDNVFFSHSTEQVRGSEAVGFGAALAPTRTAQKL